MRVTDVAVTRKVQLCSFRAGRSTEFRKIYNPKMAFNLGNVMDNFDPNTEQLTSYLERIDMYFIANGIAVEEGGDDSAVAAVDRKKVAIFISVVGKSVYGTLRDLCKPDAPREKDYTELCNVLQEHYSPRKLEVAESFRFHHAQQSEKETVADYCVKLRKLAATCNFGTYLNRALRDQFVCGVKSVDTQRKLLQADRTFEDCIKVGAADEAAGRETRKIQTFQQQQGAANLHNISENKQKPRQSQNSQWQSGAKKKQYTARPKGTNNLAHRMCVYPAIKRALTSEMTVIIKIAYAISARKKGILQLLVKVPLPV